jgi:predicted transcriptional regulator
MFDEWFNQRYLEWRGERYGQDVSVKAFARYIGLTQQSVDSYLKGKSVPRQKNIINKLVDIQSVHRLASPVANMRL